MEIFFSFNKIKNQVIKFKFLLIVFILALILFIIPNIFWLEGKYFVGGDDTLLYYLYPHEMIKKYIFNIATDNVLSGIGSYSFQFYQLPFFFLILCFKTLFPNLNSQTFFYGINLSLGFLFFYLFLGIWIKNSSNYNFWIKVIGGLLYVFSIFSYYTLWQSLFTPYLVSGFPIIIYLFFLGIKKRNLNIIVLAAVVLSLLSILLLLTPWLIIGIISILPLITNTFWKQKKYFFYYVFIFMLILFLLNFYWIMHLILPHLIEDTNSTSIINLTTKSFVQSAKETIISVTRDNNLIYPLFNLFHKDIQINGKWQNYSIFQNWHEKFILLNFLFTAIIFFAGTKLKNAKKEIKLLYISSVAGWLLILYMFTVNMGNSFGINVFVWLIDNIPGFSMFRNVYGKIAPAYPFIYAFSFAISLKIIIDKISYKLVKNIILIICFSVVVLNAKPFIFNEYFSKPLWTTKNTFTTISMLNSDFNNLTKYLDTFNSNTRFLWIPITAVNYVIIQDENYSNHYYTGLSPLQFLSGKNDITGIMSFPLEIQIQFTRNLNEKKYTDIGYLFKRMNINYLIINNDISKEIQDSYFFSSQINNLYQVQNQEFKNAVLGKKVKDFNRYELYEIKDIFKSNTIFVENSVNKRIKTNLKYKKVENYLYEVNIENLYGETEINFLERFSPFWKLKIDGQNQNLPVKKHTQIYGYANQWMVSTNQVKQSVNKKLYVLNPDGSINIKLSLYFTPQSYFLPSLLISGATLFFILIYYTIKAIFYFRRIYT